MSVSYLGMFNKVHTAVAAAAHGTTPCVNENTCALQTTLCIEQNAAECTNL
jgi:hypothetical protein